MKVHVEKKPHIDIALHNNFNLEKNKPIKTAGVEFHVFVECNLACF